MNATMIVFCACAAVLFVCWFFSIRSLLRPAPPREPGDLS